MRDDYPLLFALAALGLAVGRRQALSVVGPAGAAAVVPAPESQAAQNGGGKAGAGRDARDSD